MQINREYTVNLTTHEEEIITSITNQHGVIDDKQKLELFNSIELMLSASFMKGLNEANRLAEQEND